VSSIAVGRTAPSFRLPTGQGLEVGPADYRGTRNLIVWFTKGFACPFCRQQMSQMSRGYPQFQKLDTEVLAVTSTTPARARSYLQKFQLQYPYLCDPDYKVRQAWSLEMRSHSFFWYVKKFYRGVTTPMPENDFGKFAPPVAEMPAVLADVDMGFFIVDKEGIIRYTLSGSYGHERGAAPIPSNDEILRELEKLPSV